MSKFVLYSMVQGNARILSYFESEEQARNRAEEMEREDIKETMMINPEWIAMGGEMPDYYVAEITPMVENLISALLAELKWTRDRRNELHERVYGIRL